MGTAREEPPGRPREPEADAELAPTLLNPSGSSSEAAETIISQIERTIGQMPTVRREGAPQVTGGERLKLNVS